MANTDLSDSWSDKTRVKSASRRSTDPVIGLQQRVRHSISNGLVTPSNYNIGASNFDSGALASLTGTDDICRSNPDAMSTSSSSSPMDKPPSALHSYTDYQLPLSAQLSSMRAQSTHIRSKEAEALLFHRMTRRVVLYPSSTKSNVPCPSEDTPSSLLTSQQSIRRKPDADIRAHSRMKSMFTNTPPSDQLRNVSIHKR